MEDSTYSTVGPDYNSTGSIWNASETSTGRPTKNLDSTIRKFWMYVLFGGGAAITNAILVLILIRYKGLRERKEFLLVGALAFADFSEGFATAIAGLYRNYMIFQGANDDRISRLSCMLLPQSWLWRFSEFATSFMLVALSVDRYMAVRYPTKYFTAGVEHAYKFIGVVYGLALLNEGVSWIYPITTRDQKTNALCSSSGVIQPMIYVVSKYIAASAATLSCIIYVGVVWELRRVLQRMSATVAPGADTRSTRVQIRVTLTIGVSSLLTLFLDALPRSYGIFLDRLASPEQVLYGKSLSQYFFQMNKLNAISNFFVFGLSLAPIRVAIKSMFMCQKLPANVDHWTLATGSKSQISTVKMADN